MSHQHRNYFNELASHWALKDCDDKVYAALSRFIAPGDWVLDVGAGTGLLTRALLELTGADGHVVALDVSEKMLSQARHRLGRPLVCLCTDACQAGVVSNSVDKIVCYSTFPHFDRPVAAIVEFLRILRPSGRALIFHNCCSRKLNHFHAQLPNVVSFDKLPKLEQLIELVKCCGFDPVQGVERPDLYWVEAQKPA